MKATLSVIAILIAFSIFLTWKFLGEKRIECSLCIEFKGARQCSSALGPDGKAAAEEAHRNACALLASGVTETVTCNQAPRLDVSCTP